MTIFRSLFRRRRVGERSQYDGSTFRRPLQGAKKPATSLAFEPEEEFDFLDQILRPVLLAIMNACVAGSLVLLAESFYGGPLGLGYFQVLAFLASLEGIHSDRLARRLGLESPDEHLKFKVAEIVLWLLVLRLASYLPLGLAGLMRAVLAWANSLEDLLSVGFLGQGLLLLLFWALAIALTRDFAVLRVRPGELGPDPGSPDYDLWASSPGRHADRGAALASIRSKFFWGGAVVLIASGIARVGPQMLLATERSSSRGIVLNVLLYFLIGLGIIAQAQFLRQRAEWQLQKIPVASDLAPQWATWAGVLALAIVLVALALPTDYSLGILDLAGGIIRVIVYVLMVLVAVLMAALAFLLSLLSGRGGQGTPGPSPGVPPPPAFTQAGMALPFWEVLKNLVFWLVVLAIVGYSLRTYLSHRRGFASLFGRLASFRKLLVGLRRLWRRMRGLLQEAREKLRLPGREALASRLGQAGLSGRILRLSRLSPRELVQYFYLSTLRRAGELGIRRQSYQTPLEYSATLRPHLEGVEEELAALTGAFLEARYSQHPWEREQAEALRQPWARVRIALKALRQEWRRRGPI